MAFWSKRVKQVDEPVEERAVYSIADPAVAALFGLGNTSSTGICVTEENALTLSAVYRAVSIISSTLASLPLKTYRTLDDGSRVEVPSVFDNPAGPDSDITKFEWLETLFVHLLLHGDYFALKLKNAAGQVTGFRTIHPLSVSVELDKAYQKRFTVALVDGTSLELTTNQILHVPGLSTNGVRGISPILAARNSIGVSLAGERAAGKVFAQGAMVAGLVTPEAEDDVSAEDATAIQQALNAGVLGYENAGTLAVINRCLKVSTWQLDLESLQFLQARQWQVVEVARWFGVPTTLLMENSKQSSWGVSVQEMNLAFARYTLNGYARRVESRFSALLANPRHCEFNFAGLERPTPQEELKLLMDQVNAGALTLNEMRKIRNMGEVEGGDEIRVPSGVMLLSQLMAQAESVSEPDQDPLPADEPNIDDEEESA